MKAFLTTWLCYYAYKGDTFWSKRKEGREGGRRHSIITEICKVGSKSLQESHPSEFTAGRSCHQNHFKAILYSCFFTSFRTHTVGFTLIDCSGKHGGLWGDDLERLTSWMPAHPHIKSKHFTVGRRLRVIQFTKGHPIPSCTSLSPPPTRLHISWQPLPRTPPSSSVPSCRFPLSQLHSHSPFGSFSQRSTNNSSVPASFVQKYLLSI